jgi:hypothetical protein
VEITNTVLSVPFGKRPLSPVHNSFPSGSQLTSSICSPLDVITFVATVYYTVKQGAMRRSGNGTPSLLHTLARDGVLYFMVIFTSHIIYTFTLILGQVSGLPLNALYCDYFHRAFVLFSGLQPIVQLIPAMYGLFLSLANPDSLSVFLR